jgi:hypothetical protein
LFILLVALFHLFPLLGRIFSWKGSSSRADYKQSGKGEGPYPAGGVTRLHPLAARDLHEFARSPGRDVLGAFAMKFFLKKMGLFFVGSTPAVAPEGDLVFEGESRVALNFI